MNNKDDFIKYRELIFSKLIGNLKILPTKVIDRMCLSISIFMIIGIACFWEDCIEDIINFAMKSNENCVLSLIILENIPRELHELRLSELDLCKVNKIKYNNCR